MKKIKLLASLVIASLFPMVASADLLPCGFGKKACTVCDVLLLANNIFNFFVKISIGIAILLAVVAGIFYITSSGSEGMMTMAKTTLKFALIGFVVTILAWVFINVLVRTLGYKIPEGAEWWEIKIDCKPHENSGLSV